MHIIDDCHNDAITPTNSSKIDIMHLSKFLIINGILFVPFGLLMFFIPNVIFPLFGIDLSVDGTLMARVFGSALLSLGLICFLARKENPKSVGTRAIIWGNFIFHLLDTISTTIASLKNVMNSLGWMFAILHLLLALGFLYYFLTIKQQVNNNSL